VKSPMPLLQSVLDDMSTMCHTSTTRDLKTIARRVEHEGLSFLTITLPNFGKDLQKGLDQGYVDSNLFTGFQWKGGLPRFLSGFLCHVFDSGSGKLLSEPSVAHIQAIRQITLMFAKIELECTDARKSDAYRRFVECEQEVRNADARLDPDRTSRYHRISTLLWGDLLSAVDSLVFSSEGRTNRLGWLLPKHGPGATADRLRGNAKWRQSEWTDRLEQVFPSGEHLIPNFRYHSDLSELRFLEPGTERPVRVVDVPKTLETPRIIAIEPACMQYVQQSLLGAFRKVVDADDTASSLIGWSEQMLNQRLAQKGSRDGTLATIDLSEASDRVSNQHVRGLLRNHPHLNRAVDSCRSRKADVPGHGVIRLAKFASMGSALTFPLEAMVFATVIFVALERGLSRPLRRRDIKSFVGQVRVYGDDIIVPTDCVSLVVAELEAFGFRVNTNKSFWTGKFRESCGKEYYDGEDVSVVRMRSDIPSDRRNVREIVSSVSFRNQLYFAGLWKTARYLDDRLRRIIPFPVVLQSSPVLGRHSFLGYQTDRNCSSLHRPLVKGYVGKSDLPVSRLDGMEALLKCLVLAEHGRPSPSQELDPHEAGRLRRDLTSILPGAGDEHLERSGRPRVRGIKLGWHTPY